MIGRILRAQALAALVALTACKSLNSVPEEVGVLRGTGPAGEPLELNVQECEVAFILAGTAWCPHCKGEVEALEQEFRARQASGFCALYVSEDESEAVMAEDVKKKALSFPAVFWNYELMNALGNPTAVPAHLVTVKGKVLEARLGAVGEKAMHALLESAYAKLR